MPFVDLAGVVTAAPRPAGRHQLETRTPVHDAATDLGVERVLTPARLRDRAAVEDVLALEPALLVLADYGQIVPSALLEAPFGALNIHPSLLPRHRGATPIQAAILAGDHDTGVTLFRMTQGLDDGPVIEQRSVAIGADDDSETLERRLADLGADVLVRTLPDWLAGNVAAVPQDAARATLSRPLRRSDGRLDPEQPAVALERQVRAYRPWPGTWLETADDRLGVRRAHVADVGSGAEAGTFVADGDDLALTTSDGRLVLDEVQPAGGTPMSGAAYLRGHPRIAGTRVRRGAAVSQASR